MTVPSMVLAGIGWGAFLALLVYGLKRPKPTPIELTSDEFEALEQHNRDRADRHWTRVLSDQTGPTEAVTAELLAIFRSSRARVFSERAADRLADEEQSALEVSSLLWRE